MSILTFPALAMFYYFKKYKNHSLLGMAASAGIGVLAIAFIQFFIILGIPTVDTVIRFGDIPNPSSNVILSIAIKTFL